MKYIETLTLPIDEPEDYPGNARIHDDAWLDGTVAPGQHRSIFARRLPGGRIQILAGHGTRAALKRKGDRTVRVEIVEATDREARQANLSDNPPPNIGGFDDELLLAQLDAASKDGGLSGTGWDADAYKELLDAAGCENPFDGPGGDGGGGPNPTLADRFGIPPFDVLDARQGAWRDRKKKWLSLGIRSGLGREKGLLLPSASGRDSTYYAQKTAAEKRIGHTLTPGEFEAEHYAPSNESGTSIFDPVLCELAYRWFSGPGMTVLDPFAGGSVRGLMAGMLGRHYMGNDLRKEQVEANRMQAEDFTDRGLLDGVGVSWSIGDSADWVRTLDPESTDMVLTCPPYLFLEKYSDDPADLSNKTEAQFEDLYRKIITGAVCALRNNRFAVFVVGDVRDTKGRLIDFRGMTVRACEAAGLTLASAAIIVTPVGYVAVRAGRAFEATRTLGRTHQDMLVFCKGKAKAAAQACGPVEVEVPPEDPDADDQ